MASPLKIALAAGGVSLLVAFAPVLWHMARPGAPPAAPAEGAPWQVTRSAAGGTQVFGLQLPGATLAEARDRWGDDLALAVIDGAGAPALEGYLERFSAGGVAGRLVLAFDADAGMLVRWRDRLPPTPTGSGLRRHGLDAAARAEAAAVPLAGLSFVPSARLDAPTVHARFGDPAEVLAEAVAGVADAAGDAAAGRGRRTHWLYPSIGLAVMLDEDGRDLLQYVAPADFERRLAAPLRRPGSGPPAR